MVSRASILLYGIICYALSMVSFVLLAGFLIGIPESIGIDRQATAPLWQAALINVGLLALFAVQHSVMARPAFKRWWTTIIPESAERSTYCLFSAAALSVLVLAWEPMGGTIWHVENSIGQTIFYSLYALGWVVLVGSTFFLNHFDLFGLRQVYLQFVAKPYTALEFKIPGPYKLVRHPLYVGWLILFWMTPQMTVAHFILAAGVTAYILFAIKHEERDLVHFHGKDYEDYQRSTPMLIPRFGETQKELAA